jgi:threonine dehydrogenase-like Zn-dependent dehydrogenase
MSGQGCVAGSEPEHAVGSHELRADVDRCGGDPRILASLADAEPSVYDVVVECVGRAELIAGAGAAARARGRIVVASACDVPSRSN